MLNKITVENFKSIGKVTVDFSPTTVLVGRSGTGKSNFLQSIRFLRDLVANGTPRNHDNIVPATFSKEQRDATPLKFKVEFSVGGMPDAFRYELHTKQQKLVLEKLDLGDDTLFHQAFGQPIVPAGHRIRKPHAMRWVKAPKVVKKPGLGTLAIRQLSGIQQVVIAYTALTSGIGFYDFSDSVMVSNHPQQQPPLTTNSGLKEDASNFMSVLKDISIDLSDFGVRGRIVDALRRVDRSVSSVELDNVVDPKSVVVGHEFNKKTLTLNLRNESAGFRRFFAHLLALNQKPSKLTNLFEHPEDGVHPGAMELLAEEFKCAPQDKRGQVIFTTHNPNLLNHFDVECIRVVDLDGFNTKIGRVSDEQRSAIEDSLLDTGELLTADPARIDTGIDE